MSLHSLQHVVSLPARLVTAIAADPADLWIRALEKFSERRERGRTPCEYVADPNWEPRLHGLLGVSRPCVACAEFQELWPKVIESLTASGLRIGPQSFGPWNDGDTGLVRAMWCLTRNLRPAKVVETGVAHGLTSRFTLEAIERNGSGHLWSIDLPPTNRELQRQVGAVVESRLRDRWTYIRGSSRRHLPGLLRELAQIDLFLHDSMHSERNVRFELDRAWVALRSGGAAVVDDIDANWGFHSFMQNFPGHSYLICEAEPLQPDLRRFNGKGLFGIALKGGCGLDVNERLHEA
jgi:Methyltransferase domain